MLTDSSELTTELVEAAQNQGGCPGGMDIFLDHAGASGKVTRRLHFSYGRDGLTTIRGKILFPSGSTPSSLASPRAEVRITDSNGYVVVLSYTNCRWRITSLTAFLTCNG
jgi:hypothetical protein